MVPFPKITGSPIGKSYVDGFLKMDNKNAAKVNYLSAKNEYSQSAVTAMQDVLSYAGKHIKKLVESCDDILKDSRVKIEAAKQDLYNEIDKLGAAVESKPVVQGEDVVTRGNAPQPIINKLSQ